MVKTLVDLCTAVCIKHLREIYDVGDAPYSVLRPILMKVNSAAQLHELESKSPHIQEDDAECWKRLIDRDFHHQVEKHNFVPENPAAWGKIYDKYQKIDAAEKEAAAEKLRRSLKDIKRDKKANGSSLVNYDEKFLGRLPGRRRSITRREDGTITTSKPGGGGSRPKLTSGEKFMKKTKRELSNRTTQLAMPTGQLPVKPGQITRAPPRMGMSERFLAKPLGLVSRIQPPENHAKNSWDRALKKRRLLKAKDEALAQGANVISDDALDESDWASDASSSREGVLDADDLEATFNQKGPIMSAPTVQATKTASATSLTKSSSSFSPVPTTKASHAPPKLTGLAKMKMGGSWRNKPMTLVPVKTPTTKSAPKLVAPESAASKSTTTKLSAPTTPTTPPLPPQSSTSSKQAPSLDASAGSATGDSDTSSVDPKPKPTPVVVRQKRKEPPSIFIPRHPKARRMS